MGEGQPQEGRHQAHGPPDADPDLQANVLLAVPTLAVLRVLFDFFRARLRTRE
jgi:hypothetical protein